MGRKAWRLAIARSGARRSRGGASTGLHPHLPLLATSGGEEAQGARWEPRQYLPEDLLRRKGQWPLRTRLRQTLKTDAVHPWVAAGCRQYPDGLGTNGQQGAVPSQEQSLARYVAKYVGSPPRAVRRLARYDGARVTYHDRAPRTARMEPATVDVATLIGRMGQHTVPKGCKRIR